MYARPSVSTNTAGSMSAFERDADGVEVVSVAREDLPAIRREARPRVVLHRERGVALDRNVVGVVDDHEAAEAERAREGARLVRNPLLHVAVAAENPRAVRLALHLRGKCKADAHR